MPVQFRSIQSMSVNDRMKKLDQFDHHHSSSTAALHRGPTGVPTSGRSGSTNNSGASSSSSASAAFRMPSLTNMPLNMPISLAMASVPALNNLNNLAGFSGLVHSSSSSSAHHPTSQQQCIGDGAVTPASVGSAGSLGGSGNSFTDSDSDAEPDNNATNGQQQRRPLTNNSSSKQIRANHQPSKCDGKSLNKKTRETTAEIEKPIQFEHRTKIF